MKKYMQKLGKNARSSAQVVAMAETQTKNQALLNIADNILKRHDDLLIANQKDLAISQDKNLDQALIERLELTTRRIEAMADGLRQVASLADPIGEITQLKYRPSGIQVGQMRVSLGVIGIIYESRPNVTADAAGLCLKSGNATILRGGSEAVHSNQAIAQCIIAGLKSAGLPETTVQVINTTDRAAVGELINMSNYVDVVVPRGGKSLIERISKEATVPVIKHMDGICHVYIDDDADLDKAREIAFNAKTQRYATCNTMECLLIAENIAKPMLEILAPLYARAGVEIRGCEKSAKLLHGIKSASEKDYSTEYLAPILSLKIVSDLNEAITHIERYGSQHTDCIVTENFSRAQRFLRKIDSSSVMLNASTRFADGYEYGLGAEIGISTDKLHARGPVGLEGLTCLKYIVIGDGHTRI